MYLPPFSFLYRILPVLTLSIIAATVYWFARLNELNQAQSHPTRVPQHIAEYSVQNFSGSILNKQGLAHYRMQGHILVRYEDDHSYEITRPALRLFRPDQPELTVTAKLGKMDEQGEQIDLIGDASLIRAATTTPRASAEIRAQSETFRVLVNQDILKTDLPVQVQQGASIITANGMIYHNLDRFIEFQGNVKGTLVLSQQ